MCENRISLHWHYRNKHREYPVNSPAKEDSNGDVSWGTKEGEIVPKWNKTWTFSDQISVHFGSVI